MEIDEIQFYCTGLMPTDYDPLAWWLGFGIKTKTHYKYGQLRGSFCDQGALSNKVSVLINKLNEQPWLLHPVDKKYVPQIRM